jgi:Cadherin-like/Cadherin domain/Right handed beta helix region
VILAPSINGTVSIIGNQIFQNAALGIDLGWNGVSVNDANDIDVGANGLQNFPVLISAVSAAGSTTVSGTFNSEANTTYRLEFFRSATGLASGHGQAESFIGTVNVTTDALGNAIFNAVLSGANSAVGSVISATATVSLSNSTFGPTSEFSQNVLVSAAPPGITVSPPTSLATTEAGVTSQFSIVLNAAPSADVTITLSLSDASEASLSSTVLVFTALNWNVAQVVTVTGLDDSFVDGNVAYSVITSAALSADLAYNGLAVADIALTNTDSDTFNTLVVDTTLDSADGDTSSIAALYANKGADGKISLREAILAANNTVNGSQRDRILFNIADPLIAGAHTINVLSALPIITDSVGIDGTSEPDFGANHVVEINGLNAGAGVDGLILTANGSEIRGLTVNRFSGNGIYASGSQNSFVNNYVGVSTDGLTALGNVFQGIMIASSTATQIGGPSPGDANVISGNGGNGIMVLDSSGTAIKNNLVGLNRLATSALGNTQSGIWITGAGSVNTLVGGSLGEGNQVGGNAFSGIALDTAVSGVTVSQNFVGISASGSLSLGNSHHGVYSLASNVVIRGNALSNNGYGGVYIAGSQTVIELNAITNAIQGVVVGGSATSATISRNTMDGVGQLIDLGSDGITSNDLGDVDLGPNGFQNAPVLSAVITDALTQIRLVGSFNGEANKSFTVEVYEHGSVAMNVRSRYLGSFAMTSDASGNASFNTTLAGAFSAGTLFSLTATDVSVSTNQPSSEHSVAFAAGVASGITPAVLITSANPLVVSEAGSSTSASISLSTMPTSDVTVNLSVSIAGELTLSATSFTFTAANWNVPQVLTITGVQDFVADGNVVVTVLTANAISTDLDYSGLAVADLTVTNQAIPNLAPTIIAPPAYSAVEDTTTTLADIGTGLSTGISIADLDAGSNLLEVTLNISNGVISLGSTTGLSFLAGDGTADTTMTFRGTVAQINAAIDSLTFVPTANYFGPSSLNLTVNDLGNTGTGGALSVNKSVPINVTPVNDAATFSGTKAATLSEGGLLLVTSSMLALADIDTPTSDLVFTVTAQSVDGELQRAGVILRVGDSFTQADIDSQLIQYLHFGAESPQASITLAMSERFGGALPDAILSLTITPVNDAPVITSLMGGVIPEITAVGTVVGSVVAVDPDNASGAQFSLTDSSNGAFSIDPVTGVITVANPLLLDFETAPQHTIRVTVSDTAGATTERVFQIQLTDVLEVVPVVIIVPPTPTTPPGSTLPPTTTPPTTTVATVATVTPPSVGTTSSTPGATIVNSAPSASALNALATAFGVEPVRAATSGNGRQRQTEKDVLVLNDAVQDARATTMRRELARRTNMQIELELLDLDGNVKQRRVLNSDLLELLFNGRKSTASAAIPPTVVFGEFKLPVVDSVEVGGMVLSVGVVAWVARAGGLLAALISAMPAWKGLDPLLVLSPSKATKAQEFEEFSDTEVREDEQAVQAVLS